MSASKKAVDAQAPEDEPAFLDDDGPSAEIPSFITTTNARELFGLRPEETVSDAIARHNAEQANQPPAGTTSRPQENRP